MDVSAARPEVLPLVVEYNPECPWGHYIEFEGSRDQLIAAGVASLEMFIGLSHGGVHSGPDEFGCKFTLERYGVEKFRLMRFLMDHPSYGDPGDSPQNWSRSLRESQPTIRQFIETLLERIRMGCS